MSISPSFLNKLVNIYKTNDATVSDYGSIGNNALSLIYADIKFAIAANKLYGSNDVNMSGFITASSHKGFCDVGYDILQGYIIHDIAKDKFYTVMYADDEPAGVTDDHMEIYLRFSDANNYELL